MLHSKGPVFKMAHFVSRFNFDVFISTILSARSTTLVKLVPLLLDEIFHCQFQAVKDKGVVVIFVSSDRTPEEMMNFRAEYHSTEWLAAPHESTLSDNLGAEFSVSALPLLVVACLDGTVLSKDGRADVINYGARALDVWTEGISKSKRNCTLL